MKLYRLGLILLILSACTRGPAAPPPQAAAGDLPPTVSPAAPTLRPSLASGLKSTLTASPNETPATRIVWNGQTLEFNARDMQTVTSEHFTLSGWAPAGTVISLNDDFVLVDQPGGFSFELLLQEGPNLVEIVVSNAQGQQFNLEWIIFYEGAP